MDNIQFVDFSVEDLKRIREGGGREAGEVLATARQIPEGKSWAHKIDAPDDAEFDRLARNIQSTLNRKGALAFPVTVRTDRSNRTVRVFHLTPAQFANTAKGAKTTQTTTPAVQTTNA